MSDEGDEGVAEDVPQCGAFLIFAKGTTPSGGDQELAYECMRDDGHPGDHSTWAEDPDHWQIKWAPGIRDMYDD